MLHRDYDCNFEVVALDWQDSIVRHELFFSFAAACEAVIRQCTIPNAWEIELVDLTTPNPHVIQTYLSDHIATDPLLHDIS